MPKLTEDIRCISKPEHLYGKKGEEVSIVRHSANVCLVENAKKNRFAVGTRQLTDCDIQIKQEAAPAAAAPNKPISNRAPARKKTKAVPINQQSIF